jgi:hypothetical protein
MAVTMNNAVFQLVDWYEFTNISEICAAFIIRDLYP